MHCGLELAVFMREYPVYMYMYLYRPFTKTIQDRVYNSDLVLSVSDLENIFFNLKKFLIFQCDPFERINQLRLPNQETPVSSSRHSDEDDSHEVLAIEKSDFGGGSVIEYKFRHSLQTDDSISTHSPKVHVICRV